MNLSFIKCKAKVKLWSVPQLTSIHDKSSKNYVWNQAFSPPPQKTDTKTSEPNFISSVELANPKTMATNDQTSLRLYSSLHL